MVPRSNKELAAAAMEEAKAVAAGMFIAASSVRPLGKRQCCWVGNRGGNRGGKFKMGQIS
jgi:hypothetical protein